ncbi:MAG: PepSY domain-containing protein [Dokdonella sp.]|uniref:PepSY domain-containing protein n=1 Tax=Dokdonella sp. TaxID=2291710 RepID=UPI002C8FEC4B|nr:PepSY domain-containing protein [Dokdonella sp.]HOX72518.1 PepSY domain-containing protein [Dokdonella sp.]HPG93620.1 PepSY domain-containing protein [Dokdonella sp.]HPN78128.1 PepSY domain-containing protein [Dokdonella sp.]
MRHARFAIALGILIAVPAFADTAPTTPPSNTTIAPSTALTQQAVESRIANAGFQEVRSLTFKHGIWQADARGGEKEWVGIYVHPLSGKIFQEGAPSPLNKQEIEAKITAAGYQNVENVDFKDGLWMAEAENGSGKAVKLMVDPDDGSVIGEALD